MLAVFLVHVELQENARPTIIEEILESPMMGTRELSTMGPYPVARLVQIYNFNHYIYKYVYIHTLRSNCDSKTNISQLQVILQQLHGLYLY